MAFSASLAGSMPVIPLARAGAMPVTGNTPPCLCASTCESSTSLTSMFSGNADKLPSTDGTPPVSYRSLPCASGGFEGSGQWVSVAHHSVVTPSPHEGFLHARVSDGNGIGGKGNDKDWKF